MSTSSAPDPSSNLLLGATPGEPGDWNFLVFAREMRRVEVVCEEASTPLVELKRCGRGYYAGTLHGVHEGARYRYRLNGEVELADPSSRHQPEGVRGPSALFDPSTHLWSDSGFVAGPLSRAIIYEFHVGTFTREGTLDAAASLLPYLAELGVTAVEPMPLAQFSGVRNWGYDGVFPFAIQSSYGGPAGLQRFVDECHRYGVSVILDVVYNHLGPEGNILARYGPYFSDLYRTPWGGAINYDGPGSDEVRRYFIENALRWFSEFHVDALRLDAIQGIIDLTARPFLVELVEATEALSKRLGRPLGLIAESADNNPMVTTPRGEGGIGFDSQWNDDFHHALQALLTGERAAYYSDFGSLADLGTAISHGFVFEGQYSSFRDRRHGGPLPSHHPERLVVFSQNHDQVGNRPFGDRLSSLVDLSRQRLAAAALLLSPQVPLLFMGEEYGEVAPFPYFVDHEDEALLEAVRRGRALEFQGLFESDGDQRPYLDPSALETFAQAYLDRDLRFKADHAELFALYRRLIELRRSEPLLCDGTAEIAVDVAQDSGLLSVVRTASIASGRSHPLRPARLLVSLHFGSNEVALKFPPAPEGWVRLLDSSSRLIGGSGKELPLFLGADRLATSGASLLLDAGAFCVYRTREQEYS
ncbi:MAG: malto-oligosyltrehalose trehalohydrolase [Ferrimicrobium sp.]